MEQKFKIKTWIWVVLAVVVAGGLGFGLWYYNYKVNGTSTTATSPSPSKSLVVSPLGKTTATPAQTSGSTGNQTSTPSGGDQTPTPASGNQTWQGTVNSYYTGTCAPTISFSYSSDSQVKQSNYAAGTGSVIVNRNGSSSYVSLDSIRDCNNYASPKAYFDSLNITDIEPTELTINGYSALQYGNNTIITNNGKWLSIRYDNSSDKDIYDLILSSVKFQ